MTLETSILRRTAFGFLSVFAVAMVVFLAEREPQTLGHPLSFWLSQLDGTAASRHPETDAALTSLRHVAWPELRRRLIAREGFGHQFLARLRRLSPRFAPSTANVEAHRLQVVQFAETLGEQASPLIPELSQAFRITRRSETREAIGKAWIQMGSAAVPAIGVLVVDPDPTVRVDALHAFASVLAESDPTVSARSDLAVLFTSQLSVAEIPVVLAATRALTLLAADATLAVPILVQHLTHPIPAVREATAVALGRIANRDAVCVGPLTKSLSDPVDGVRSASANALAQFGPLAAPVVPQLVDAWNVGPAPVALAAIHALGRIGPRAASAVPELASELVQASQSSILRSSAATALGRIARQPNVAVPALIEATGDADPGIRQSAVRALAAFGPEAEAAVPALIAVLTESSESIRILAAEALGRIGPGARSAVPFLEAARNNNQSVMSSPVLVAVARIQGSASTSPTAGLGESSP